jgi:hypothetical protein
MPYRSWSQSRARPRTYIGQLLRAMFLRQKELRNELQGKLNGGKPGWNDDEPVVVELVFQRVLRLFLGKEYDARDIEEFLDFVELAVAGDPPVDRLQAENLIREAMGEPGVEEKNASPQQKYVLRLMMAGMAALHLELDEGVVDEMITDSERLAFERGWKPPLIRDKKRAARRR